MSKKFVIVGGVAGGASASTRLRRLDEDAEIILLERSPHVSFANCGLPYYLGGAIRERGRLLVQTPQSMHARFRIDVRTRSEVTGIDAARRVVRVRSEGREYEESYDKLLLSPGANPVRPRIAGIDDERVLTLRNLNDVDGISHAMELALNGDGKRGGSDVPRVVVVGGGFIGVEIAENLKNAGMDVALFEAGNQVLAPFDEDMASFAAAALIDHGVNLHLGSGVEGFDPVSDAQGRRTGIRTRLSGGRSVDSDFVVLAIGVRPDTSFLAGSGVELDERGYIVVDDELRTSVPDIYAVGDAIRLFRHGDKRPMSLALAGPANHQGRTVAGNMMGGHAKQRGFIGSSIVKVFGTTLAATGLNEKTLAEESREYDVVIAHPLSHAGYYPGAQQMALKLIFGRDGKVLGAQAAGGEGVDKRIDVVATAISMGATVSDLTDLELCYAPPFNSAKDPVNMVGYMAENVLDGLSTPIRQSEWRSAVDRGALLLDVRTPGEFANGNLEGAINMPLDSLREHLSELDKSRPIVIYCQVGLRGYLAERILKPAGFNVSNLVGGYRLASVMARVKSAVG